MHALGMTLLRCPGCGALAKGAPGPWWAVGALLGLSVLVGAVAIAVAGAVFARTPPPAVASPES